MKKVLLTAAGLGMILSANAQQNLNYGFEVGDQLPTNGQILRENWSEFPGTSYSLEFEGGYASDRCLYVSADSTISEAWKRQISFDYIGLKEQTSYRVSFMLKGNGKMNVALLKGCFNHDLALQCGQGEDGSKYEDETTDQEFNSNSWQRKNFVFWAPSRAAMDAKRRSIGWLSDEQKADMMNDSIWALDFLRLSFLNKGEYFIDNLVVEESTINGLVFNDKAINVDFGYATNLADYTEKASCMTKEKFTVTVNGKEVEVASVEALKETVDEVSNTRLVIFTTEEIPNNADVKVSYVNSVGKLYYTTNKAPFCIEEPNGKVKDFTNETAYYDKNFSATSLAEMGAVLWASTPANMYFQADPTVSTFEFKFSMPVLENDEEEYGKPVATLDGEALELVGYGASDSILVFKRNSEAPLANGQHTLAIKNVTNEYGIPSADEDMTPSLFEVGGVNQDMLDNYNQYNTVFYEDNCKSIGTSGSSVLPNVTDGWRLWEKDKFVAWGVNRNGTGGILDVNTSFKRGLYLRLPNADQFCWLYGLYTDETDSDGKHAPELVLPAGEMMVSYEVIGWDGTKPNTWFEIFTYEEGKDYTDSSLKGDILSKKVTCQDNCKNGNEKSGVSEKVSVKVEVPAAGRYVIKLKADYQAVFGNIILQRIGSYTLLYQRQLNNNAITPAEEELAASADDKYVGTTKSALAALIETTKTTAYHTDAEFSAATKALQDATAAMKARRTNMDAYASKLQELIAAIEAVEEKFKQTAAYINAANNRAIYEAADPVAMSDEELATAVATIGSTGEFLANATGTCYQLVTAQMRELSTAILRLNSELGNEWAIVAAGNALDNDEDIVNSLKKLYVGSLYKKIAEGTNFFAIETTEYDEVEGKDVTTTVKDSIDMSFMIANRVFYSTAQIPAGQTTVDAQVTDFPGWTIELNSGSIRPIWSTGWGQKGPTATCPVVDCAVSTGWGTANYDVNQTLEFLPAGTYSASLVTGVDGTSNKSCAYYVVATADSVVTDSTYYAGDSRDNATPQKLIGINPTVADNYASFKLGAHVNVAGSFGKVDNATLYMTAPAAGFDYAKAAEAILGEVVAVEKVQRTDAPVAVEYINLAGQRTAAKGVNIKVERYSDGTTVVKKVLVK